MCGLVGLYEPAGDRTEVEAIVLRMRDTMIRRGPDDCGLESFQLGRGVLGLGHRRLSIIDLSARGRQPMSTPDGQLSIIFNGEIFNHAELRAELVASRGCVFRTATDTEVMLQAIREWGMDRALARFRGMYAFAIFDRADESVALARDPLGVKPLYYSLSGGRFAFASEIKALFAHPAMTPRIEHSALLHYLTFANTPAPLTMFEGIRKLEAGTLMRFDATGALDMRRYWDPATIEPDPSIGEDQAIEQLRYLLRQAVSRRMVSDVPFGVFLSGGIDSSLNVALMAERMDRPVETFSIGISGDTESELARARDIAMMFRANHHEIVIGDAEFLSYLEQLAYVQDEPLADPVCVPLHYLSELARKSGTKVIQVGEGSDEIFGGYGMYGRFERWHRLAFEPLMRFPGFAKQAAYQASRLLRNPALEDAGRRAAHGEPLFIGNAVAFWDSEKSALLRRAPGPEQFASHYIKELALRNGVKDPLASIINIELKNRLPELLLMRVDKVTMASSIEARVPFLDEDVVEFALRIPSSLKIANGQGKYILKRAAEGLIPHETIYRRKRGFCGSATNMVTPRVAAFARNVLRESALVEEYFHRPYIDALFDQHAREPRFNGFKIWNLLNLALWHGTWFRSREAAGA
jgi:asparagine synthase (glutamine-hydrolysing)